MNGKSALDLARARGNVAVAAALEAWVASVPRLAGNNRHFY